MVRVCFILFLSLLIGCGSSVDDALDLAEGPERKPIDTSRLGVNAFGNDMRFGSPASQYRDIRDTLGLSFVRVLFNWDDDTQASPGSSLFYGFYDEIIDSVPSGVDVLIVMTGLPSWMVNPASWVDGNPRITFVERFVKKIVQRYGTRGRIIAFQIWNEPNMVANPDNTTLEVANNPDNYVELLAAAYTTIKDLAPSKLVLNASTTAINQNFPGSLDYNRGMRDAGAREFTDVWAIHYYGQQFENLIRKGGVADFLNSLNRIIWVTESGAMGLNNQLRYAEETWPYLREKIPGVDRIYIYQYSEATPGDVTYGLRNLATVSDLYVHLRERAAD